MVQNITSKITHFSFYKFYSIYCYLFEIHTCVICTYVQKLRTKLVNLHNLSTIQKKDMKQELGKISETKQ